MVACREGPCYQSKPLSRSKHRCLQVDEFLAVQSWVRVPCKFLPGKSLGIDNDREVVEDRCMLKACH